MSKQLEFVFTGILEGLTRADGEKMVADLGHKVASSVKRSTSYLVAGIRPGSKLSKAEDLGVQILNEQQFMDLVKKTVRFTPIADRPKVTIPPMSSMGPETIPGKYFLVGEIDWQYNDEYYHRGYNGEKGVTPTKLFRRRSVALEEKARLEKENFAHCEIMHYTQERGLESFFEGRNYEYFRALFWEYFGKDLPEYASDFEYGDDLADNLLPMISKLPMDRFINITRFLDFGFYEIHEVALGD